MGVTPLGNITYINQNTQVSAIHHANAQQKVDFQAMVNLQQMNEKLEEISEVRPPEESKSIDPDREKERERGHEERLLAKKKREAKESEESLPPLEPHLLDIKI